MKKKYLSEQFCQGLLDLYLPWSKALANSVLALSSYCEGKSLVELSLSPLFHHQYSSIFKCIADLHDSSKEGASYFL